MAFHEGELAVQEQAGVLADASRVGRMLRNRIPLSGRGFLEERRFVAVAARVPDGDVWTSVVAGRLPFMSVEPDGTFLGVAGVPRSTDPIAAGLVVGGQIGLVAIDFETRRRYRVNGRLTDVGPGGLRVQVEEAFGNCPKYIQAYVPRADGRESPRNPAVGRQLGADQAAWIGRADFLFLGTLHPAAGPDASHRGGAPGFVRVQSPTELSWGDYFGNALFQSLGNAAVEPRAGLLFLDPETGSTLQLTGSLSVDWSPEAAAEIPGAERVVRFQISTVVETRSAVPLRWILSEPSPFNPPAR